MLASAASVQGMISIASVMQISATGAGNLQDWGFLVPMLASSDMLAAPSQYQMRRQSVSVTSLPLALEMPGKYAGAIAADDYILVLKHW